MSKYPVETTTNKFKDHPRKRLMANISSHLKKTFSFQCISLNETLKEIENLSPKKSIQATDISIYHNFLYFYFCISFKIYHNSLSSLLFVQL